RRLGKQAGYSSGCFLADSSACSLFRAGEAARPYRMPRFISEREARMMSNEVPVLTIDGPSGSGKGTISRAVAARLGWHYLDSGALYRAVGVAAGWGDLDLDDAGALVRCAFDTTVDFRDGA